MSQSGRGGMLKDYIYGYKLFFIHKHKTVFFITFKTKIPLISKSEIKNLLLIYICIYLLISCTVYLDTTTALIEILKAKIKGGGQDNKTSNTTEKALTRGSTKRQLREAHLPRLVSRSRQYSGRASHTSPQNPTAVHLVHPPCHP